MSCSMEWVSKGRQIQNLEELGKVPLAQWLAVPGEPVDYERRHW